MSLLGRIKTSSALSTLSGQRTVPSATATNPEGDVGLGPVSSRPIATSQREPISAKLGGVVLTAVAAMLLATSPVAAQTGAPLEAEPTRIEASAASAEAEVGSRWEQVALSPEQVVVSRFYEANGLAADVRMQVPWPADAPQDIVSAGLWVFARDDAANARVEDGVLHVDFTSERGIVEGLKGAAVFHLWDADGTLHLLSVDAPEFTVDDTRLQRQEAERFVASLEERVTIMSRFDDGESLAEAKADLAEARATLAEFDAGRSVTYIHR